MNISLRRGRGTAVAPATLADVPIGGDAILSDINVPQRLGRRLAELGLRPGRRVAVAQRIAGGGRVISTGGVRYAIDSTTLAGIEVSA